ncbi:MAG: phenylalanine--tRNA ligase subunit alpha [Bacillota bacterium]|nr:phenylalanine--tRNA ligase subunit alpha [Bacillota bacterium]
MLKKLEELRSKADAEILSAKTLETLEKLRNSLMGKKGELTAVLKGIGSLSPEEKQKLGKIANELKAMFQERLELQKEKILSDSTVLDYPIDLSRPGNRVEGGGLHPITQMCYDLNDAFRSMGFEIFSGDEITSERFAFDNLNFPPDHPARESMDTYWIEGTEDKKGAERLCLRPHLTGASVRYLQKYGAPARFVYPGRVFRNEATDARHERAFFQYEVLMVEKDFSFSAGKLFIDTILEKVFGEKVETRMRTGFFPFVEPGFEIDMKCRVCKGKGCKVCKQVGWIEVMPGGTPHPNVLKAAGLDPAEYTGFYVNIGLDRMVMMRYGIDDVRLFHSADLRFLNQFN